jgi:HEAT repeat protein
LILAFIDIGDDTVYYLSRMIEHRQWYVVRNVAYLLGRLQSTAGLVALERVLHHPDVRVRREVLRAAATIRGPEGEGLLRRGLDDPEPAIAALAAEWLGIVNAPGILEEFRAMLRGDDKRLRSCHELASGVVRAVGRMGDQSDLSLIEGFKRQSQGFTIIRHADVAKACDQAVRDIHRRLDAPDRAANREASRT